MPELPDLTVYLESLEARIANRRLLRIVLLNPFLLRTALPPIAAAAGKIVRSVGRVGKRIVIGLEGDLHLVLHLMVAGRLRWDGKPPRRITLALFEFDSGTLAFTEAGTKRRASLHLVEGKASPPSTPWTPAASRFSRPTRKNSRVFFFLRTTR